ncbi:unnamed protein product [Gongylonema pulchrum]|uniref:SusD_RagB domain-containing protein n=1 Tax=Gongylonema pulchrum TaxID=637853 RepID=A0A183CUS4_9BILA|nr:unnamed protein product [Gongylonema pulchrum]
MIFITVPLTTSAKSNRSANPAFGIRYQLGQIIKFLYDNDPLGMLSVYASEEFLRAGAAERVERLKRDFLNKQKGISITGNDVIFLDLNNLKKYENGDAFTEITLWSKIIPDITTRNGYFNSLRTENEELDALDPAAIPNPVSQNHETIEYSGRRFRDQWVGK